MDAAKTTAPSDGDLQAAATSLRESHPSLGIVKLLAQLKIDHPDWQVSEKRFRKFVPAASGGGGNDAPGTVTGAGAGSPSQVTAGPSQNSEGEKILIAQTGFDPSIDVAALAPKIKAKMFSGGKGKGLVAKEKLLGGEMIWQEEPWVVTPDPGLYPYLTSRQMCSQCFNLFERPAPPMSVPCNYCPEAHFCNRLCYAKARGHHDLLCPGQNKEAASLLSFIRQKGTRSLDAVARIIALWRGEREWGDKDRAKAIEDRVWKGIARVSQKDKETERREWEFIGQPRLEEWRMTHLLLVKVLNPAKYDDNHKPFVKLLTGKRKARPIPLTEEEEERWFSFESFLQLLGLVGLNQEDSGGLYALHAHLNHSCEPNVQVRNLPKDWKSPTASELPANLPPPMNASNRGTNKLTMLARKTIHPGDELVISYVNQNLSMDERRNALREGYGFWCACTRCVREKKEQDKAKKVAESHGVEGQGREVENTTEAENRKEKV
ncbi:protein lysine methyltransferase SET5 [Kwoniella heveanensis CBS 569]|uniref:Histone-lysine N-methyltransferase SET5 n=1 Tax=Kwoniella heveanensis BCC8398 TaxID=1296120 RepID=A0A1B9GUS0_9TREE|nr:protein lysine methyltransferase SET5 [Kwoniella heveanensis BCC8398]OCF43125.1 protein lysine methyltransferase SET5 [Kwoniella heveanensis CBS 569]